MHIISGKPKVHPQIFSGKKLLKNVILQIYPSNKNFPHMMQC